MKLRILFQLLIPTVLLLSGLVFLATYLAFKAAENTAVNQIELQMRTIGHTLAEARYPLNDAVLTQIKAFSGLDLFVWDGRPTSTLTTRTDRLMALAKETASDQVRLQGPIRVDDRIYRIATLRLPPRASATERLVVLMYPEEGWRKILQETVRPVLAIAAVGGLVAVGSIAAVTFRLSRRIRMLKAHTKNIATGDYRPITVPGLRDEVSDLCDSINEMAAQLAKLHENAKTAERLRLVDQISGGLAHQLRNNIAGAKLAVQVHLREQSPEAQTDALEVALRQLTLLEERLHGYLDLRDDRVRDRRECSLGEIAEEIIELFRPRCRHFHINLRWESPEQRLVLRAFRDQLHQLFVNLVDNAIDAAGPEGSVAVRLTLACNRKNSAESEPEAVFLVEDSGSGPDADLSDRLFEPFTTSKEGGVGLGLSIAARVAKTHGGSLRWYRRDGHTFFEARLPCRVAHQDQMVDLAAGG